jgi:hypothetical protein
MRMPTLFLLAAAAACGGGGGAEDYVVIEDFLGRSPRLECDPVVAPPGLTVTELRTGSDTTVLVLDGPGRRLVELDAALRPVWELNPPADGPGAMDLPVSVAVLGDTAVAITEQVGLKLLVYGRSGGLIRATPLGFAPSGLAARPAGDLMVTAMPYGQVPANLVFRYDGETFHPLPVVPRPYPDMLVGALGNTTLADALLDGTVLVVHQFLEPGAYRLAADGGAQRLRVPTPDGTRDRIGQLPRGPLLEAELGRMLVPARAMTVDGLRSEVYLLTRTGRQAGGYPEPALLRLDRDLALIESFTLGFNARHLAFLPRQRIALVVDDEDGFHACDFGRPGGAAGAP